MRHDLPRCCVDRDDDDCGANAITRVAFPSTLLIRRGVNAPAPSRCRDGTFGFHWRWQSGSRHL